MGRRAELANGKLAVSQFPSPTGLTGAGRDPRLCVHACAALTRLHSCWGAGYAWAVHSTWVLWLLGTKRSGVLPIPSPPTPAGSDPTLPEGELNHRKETQVLGQKGCSVLGFLCLAVPAPHAQALAELPGSAAHTKTTRTRGHIAALGCAQEQPRVSWSRCFR